MTDWRERQLHDLVHFSDGGTGRRLRDEPLAVGDSLVDGGSRYRVVKVDLPRARTRAGRRLGRARARLRAAGLFATRSPLRRENRGRTRTNADATTARRPSRNPAWLSEERLR